MQMEKMSRKNLISFYTGHLKNAILPFWMDRGIDREYGGYFTCFNNEGTELVSTDKYTWSQGRMVWLLAKLSKMSCFTAEERSEFRDLAKQGAYFLMENSILENGNCTFVMERNGTPKPMKPGEDLDISIGADRFVILGLSRYSAEWGGPNAYKFASDLYKRVQDRLRTDSFKSYPYPQPQGFITHSKHMSSLYIAQEMAYAAEKFFDPAAGNYKLAADEAVSHILYDFVDEDFSLHEMKKANNEFDDATLLGRYINPGHTIEDMWFVLHQAVKNSDAKASARACSVLERTLEIGWDKEYGGLYLFADRQGGQPRGSTAGYENEEMVRKITNDWANKLWWPHSEALYTTLLAWCITGDDNYRALYSKVHDYTFTTFPNPDKAAGEWIQIRDRSGRPESKVVALPVKDPFHIMRNVILAIELLQAVEAGRDLAGVLV